MLSSRLRLGLRRAGRASLAPCAWLLARDLRDSSQSNLGRSYAMERQNVACLTLSPPARRFKDKLYLRSGVAPPRQAKSFAPPLCARRSARQDRSPTGAPSTTRHSPAIITRSARWAPQRMSAASGSCAPEKRGSSSLNSARSASCLPRSGRCPNARGSAPSLASPSAARRDGSPCRRHSAGARSSAHGGPPPSCWRNRWRPSRRRQGRAAEPAASSSQVGQMPEASTMFEAAQWQTPTFALPSRAISSALK